jgi:ABC-type nitrate/sulfonate/bicarbonate transport system permease component
MSDRDGATTAGWLRDEIRALLILAKSHSTFGSGGQSLDIPPWLLPAPTDIVDRFFKTKMLWYHTGFTVLEALAGFLISAVLGVSLSAGIVHSRFLERGVFPYVIVSNAIPIIAVIPLLTIWFGFGLAPKIMICAIISFFPIVTNTTRGLKSADRRIIEFMRSINAKRSEILFKVQLPSALPFIHLRELQDCGVACARRRRGR